MEAVSTVVIKIKYGDILRRFNAQMIGDELDFTLDGLKEKIRSLFNLSPDVELILTYIDEDGDVVHLANADDFCNAVQQHLNPLRITVQLGSQPNASQSSGSTGSSMSQGQLPLQNLQAGITEILKTVLEPPRETLVNLSSDITSKALSSSPHITELVDAFSKIGLSYIAQPSDSQTGVQTSKKNEPKNSTSQTENKDSDIAKVNAAVLKVPVIQEEALVSNEGFKKGQHEGYVKNDKPEVRNVTKMDIFLSKPRNRYPVKKQKINNIRRCYPNEKSPLIFSSLPSVASQNFSLEKRPGESSHKYLNPGNNLPTKEANKLREAHGEPKTTETSVHDPISLLVLV